MFFKRLFSRKWILLTLLVLVAIGVMLRLGIWQLDRLEQRRVFNRQVSEMRSSEALHLSQWTGADLLSQEYRKAIAVGEYDYDHELILGNQAYRDQLGVHLLTPMKITATGEYILVDRGWIPFSDYQNNTLEKYQVNENIVAEGLLYGGTDRIGVRDCLADNISQTQRPLLWCVDLSVISTLLPFPIESAYLLREPVGIDEPPPVGTTVQFEISEGPHLGYAVQWFSFALLLLVGYPFFVHRETQAQEKKIKSQVELSTDTVESSI